MLDPAHVALMKKYGERKSRPGAVTQSGGDPPELPLRFTFSEDGIYVMKGSIFGHPLENTCSWTLKAEADDSVTITLISEGKPAEDMSFTFLNPTVIRTDTKAGGMYLRRSD